MRAEQGNKMDPLWAPVIVLYEPNSGLIKKNDNLGELSLGVCVRPGVGGHLSETLWLLRSPSTEPGGSLLGAPLPFHFERRLCAFWKVLKHTVF